MAEFAAIGARWSTPESRAYRVLDFHLYQLAAHPPLRARIQAQKYKGKGLVVIGVHSPEFEFEKSLDNVRHAVKDMNIDYPVAVDGDHAIWRALRNNYWPALYFVDAQGLIRHHQFGEGNYSSPKG